MQRCIQLLTLLAVALASAICNADYNAIYTITGSANGASYGPAISSNGNRIAFYTDGSNFLTGVGAPAILVYDTSNSTYYYCSPGLTTLSRPSISRDGKYVAFYGGDGFNAVQPYVYDIANTTLHHPTVSSNILGVTWETFPPAVSNSSNDTPILVYVELDNRLTMTRPPTAIPLQIMAWQVGGGSPTVVSKTTGGVDANANCSQPVVSTDGTLVAFTSTATNLASNTGGGSQVFLSTNSSGWSTGEAISKDASGTLLGLSSWPTMDATGDRVAFQRQTATKVINVWVRDRSANVTWVPYVPAGSFTANEQTYQPSISPDGGYLTYISFQNLAGETNCTNALDTYPGPMTIGNLGQRVYVQTLSQGNTTTPVMETYRDAGGGVRKIRNGENPCLSNEAVRLAFGSASDRLDGSSWPSFSWIWYRDGGF